MTDDDLLALCIYEEAAGESQDGRAAVARVIKNRMTRHFMSDGTLKGTILKKDQFSWAWFDFVNGKYTRVAHDLPGAEAIADQKFKVAHASTLATCEQIGRMVMAGTFTTEVYDQLTDDTVNYLNPAIVPVLPAWASKDKRVCVIGHHSFFRS